jgi:hypothetical protein
MMLIKLGKNSSSFFARALNPNQNRANEEHKHVFHMLTRSDICVLGYNLYAVQIKRHFLRCFQCAVVKEYL